MHYSVPGALNVMCPPPWRSTPAPPSLLSHSHPDSEHWASMGLLWVLVDTSITALSKPPWHWTPVRLLWVLVDPCPSITFCPSHPDTEHLWAYSKCWLTPAPPSLFCSSHPDTEHLWVYSDCWSTPASMFCPSHSDTEHGASKGLHGVLRGRLL